MPAQDFTVHVDPDDLAAHDLAAKLFGAAASTPSDRPPSAEHHGAHDARQEARERSGRSRAGRAAGASSGRSYAFRRS
jgi:hypothetical protein